MAAVTTSKPHRRILCVSHCPSVLGIAEYVDDGFRMPALDPEPGPDHVQTPLTTDSFADFLTRDFQEYFWRF